MSEDVFEHNGFYKQPKNWFALRKTEAYDITVPADQRGKKERPNKKNAEIHQMMKEHIFSFRPSISHYRRNAPLWLYLSPEINMTTMFTDFL